MEMEVMLAMSQLILTVLQKTMDYETNCISELDKSSQMI